MKDIFYKCYKRYLVTISLYLSAKFGNGVLSYFLFLKSLLFLNIMIFLVEFCFVVIPQLLSNYSKLFPADPTQNTTSAVCPATNNTFYKSKNAADHLLDFFTGQVRFSFKAFFVGWIGLTIPRESQLVSF